MCPPGITCISAEALQRGGAVCRFTESRRETRLEVTEFKELELSALEARLRELQRAPFPVAGSEDNLRLRHELEIQAIRLEMQRRELEAVREERDKLLCWLDSDAECHNVLPDDATASEQQSRFSDDFSRAVFNSLPAQIAVLDGNGNIVAANRAWLSDAGRVDTPPVVRGRAGENYLQLQRDPGNELFGEAPLLVAGIESLLAGTRAEFKLEYANHTAGQHRWFMVWSTPMAGASRGAVVANVDISARVRAQEEAKKRGEDMARAVKLSSVGILASAIAHEITQPLTAVGQFSSAAVAMLYSGEAKPQDLAEVLLAIDSEVQRAGEVMRRLKVFMGRGAMARLPVDLHTVFDAAIGMVRPQLEEANIALHIEITDAPLGVVADQVQLTQVMVNLLHNSIEAICRAQSRERQIRIRSVREGEWFHVLVCDTGPGVVPEWRDSIFDLLDPDKSKGAGMGLAISRSIIEDHGGRLWAESETGIGAIFHFTLPAMQEETGVE